jgi:hypothetical protein
MSRNCSHCGKQNLTEGFVIDDGSTYFCDEKCLFVNISFDDYMDMHNEGLSYWTQFDDEEETQ